jgi:hypothetical protein
MDRVADLEERRMAKQWGWRLRREAPRVEAEVSTVWQRIGSVLQGRRPEGPRVCEYGDPVRPGEEYCIKNHYVGSE